MENIKVLTIEDLPHVLNREEEIRAKTSTGSIEEEMAAWNASWRKESLEHYLPLGWSFGIWDSSNNDKKLVGYFLAQPLLFINSFTQNLWVEYFSFDNEQLAETLFTVAYKTSREKHFQKMLVKPDDSYDILKIAEQWKPKKLDKDIIEFKTAKIQD